MEKPEFSRPGLSRRGLIAGAASLIAPSAFADAPSPPLPFNLRGRFEQSGYCVGQAATNAELWIDGTRRGNTSANGWFYVGFDRDSPATCRIEIRTAASADQFTCAITPRTYDVQRVDGLPPETVTPQAPETLERIKRDTALKNTAFASRDDTDHFKGGFLFPLKSYRVSGQFGNQRVLNGVPKSPHYGFDMAASAGTSVFAPQAGLVVLAEPDMFFEGGLTLIDHGQGLISMYQHQSQVLVKKGDRVVQGQLIGKVGAKGRATGPHLCWRLKWADRRMDPSLMAI